MDHIYRSHHHFTHLKRRGIVPLVTHKVSFPGRSDVPNPENVQGDVIYVFPKVGYRILSISAYLKDGVGRRGLHILPDQECHTISERFGILQAHAWQTGVR